MQQPHSPVVVLREGGQHKIENAAGMTIIVMKDTRLDVGDGAMVYAFASPDADGDDLAQREENRPLIRITGDSTVVSYGALVQQESGTVHGNDATEIYSTGGTATVADRSVIHLIEGSTTRVTARNSSSVLLHQPHPGAIALYDFSTASGRSRAILSGSDLRIFSASASAWIGNPEDEGSVQFTRADDGDEVAAATPAQAPATGATLSAPAPSRRSEVPAAEVPAAAAAVRPTPPSPPPAPPYVPPQDPSIFNEKNEPELDADGSGSLPAGAPIGHVLYEDYPTDGLVLADWAQMWPWIRGPWWEVTASVGTHPDVPMPALAGATTSLAAAAGHASHAGQRLGTVTVPDVASLSTQRFTPPGM